MPDLFRRIGEVISPEATKSAKVYNPGVVFDGENWHAYYRACVVEPGDWYSRLHHATSSDGITWRNHSLFLAPGAFLPCPDTRGYEDPRITWLEEDQKWLMTFTAYDGVSPRLCLAETNNFTQWVWSLDILSSFRFLGSGGYFVDWARGKPNIVRNHNPLSLSTDDVHSKSGAIFPHKLLGKYWMMFGEYCCWLASSPDGETWTAQEQPFLQARLGTQHFDNVFVEAAAPPLAIGGGQYVVLYHGIDEGLVYRLGWLVVNDKLEIVARCTESIFEPQGLECSDAIVDIVPGMMDAISSTGQALNSVAQAHANSLGLRPQVAFVTSAIVHDGMLRLYYGAGDKYIGAAEMSWTEFVAYIRRCARGNC